MNAQEYFSRAKCLDQQIDSKIEQLSSLKDLAKKCTMSMTGMPRSRNRGKTAMEDTIVKIIDLQDEINGDIDRLVDLKREMAGVIRMLPSPELRTLLELRYLCFRTWPQIAAAMDYSVHHLYKLHRAALDEVEKWIPDETF